MVPKKPLKISKGLLFPQGFIPLFFIIKDVINKLKNDLKSTNSKIGILLSIFFTQTVIKLKNREASNRENLLYFEFIFNKLGDSDIYF